jgi:hypothetical protein
MNPKEELKKLNEHLLKENKNLKTTEEACTLYLKGYKLRRYITSEIIELMHKIKPTKRNNYNNIWDYCWVFNTGAGKQITNEKYSVNDLLSPIEVYDKYKNNELREFKLWEIKE